MAAVGRAEMVRGDWIKAGAAVIDVGQTSGPLTNDYAQKSVTIVWSVDLNQRMLVMASVALG